MKRKPTAAQTLKAKYKASLEMIDAIKIERGRLTEQCREQDALIIALQADKRRIDNAIRHARPSFAKYNIEAHETMDRQSLVFTRFGVSITLTYALVLQLGVHPIIQMFAGDSRDVRAFLDGIADREKRLPLRSSSPDTENSISGVIKRE